MPFMVNHGADIAFTDRMESHTQRLEMLEKLFPLKQFPLHYTIYYDLLKSLNL